MCKVINSRNSNMHAAYLTKIQKRKIVQYCMIHKPIDIYSSTLKVNYLK